MSVGVGHSTHQEVLASACHYDRALSLEHLFSPITLELVNWYAVSPSAGSYLLRARMYVQFTHDGVCSV